MAYTRTLNNFGVPIYGSGGSNAGKIGMLQPKPRYRFRVRVVGFGDNINQEDLTRQIATVSKPRMSHEVITVDSYNSRAYYAGKHQWEEISMTVRDDITNKVSRLVGNQVQKQLNHFEQTAHAAGTNYKFDMFIETLDGGNTNILEQWYIEGCFLSNVSYEDLDYGDSNPQTITMNVRYDNAQYWGQNGTETLMSNAAPISNAGGTML